MAKEIYDETFYTHQMVGSQRSAQRYAEFFAKFLLPSSVVDVGCGRGTWLSAWRSVGVSNLVGVDGPWNKQANMIDPNIKFISCNLDSPEFDENIGRFDLAMSVEVAEHLRQDSSVRFVKSLASLSDAVVFGAAFSMQGGTNHINERSHSDWAEMFLAEGYRVYDLFRPHFWGDRSVEVWYRQNTFLYLREESPAADSIHNKGVRPLENLAFMNCMHPDLYLRRVKPTILRGAHMIYRSVIGLS